MKRLKSLDISSVYLYPGAIYIAEEPTIVTTVLGSCVSVTMFSPVLQRGAISHCTLPGCRFLNSCNDSCIETFKYVDCTLRHMLRHFRTLGVQNETLEIKIFGGADTLKSVSSNTIGTQNVKSALDVIKAEKLRVIAADVGDSFGRKIIFLSHTGEVFVKRLKKSNGNSIQ
jgi:chemotaxis protein CheD